MNHQNFQEPAQLLPASVRWRRGAARIEGEWITLLPGASEYHPGEAPDLAFDLAALRRPLREVDIERFVASYGLLRHAEAGEREEFREWEITISQLDELFQVAVALRKAVAGDAEGMRRLHLLLQGRWLAMEPTDLCSMGALWLARTLDHHLRDVEVGIAAFAQASPERKYRIGFDVRADTLIGFAHHQLAAFVTNEALLERCVGCGRFFVQHDRRMVFCTRRCGRTTHSRRFYRNQVRAKHEASEPFGTGPSEVESTAA